MSICLDGKSKLEPLIPKRKIAWVENSESGISLLTCHDDLPLLIIALNSFYHFSKLQLPCQVFDDGSLTKKDHQLLKKKFPGIKIIPNTYSYTKTIKLLQHYPFSKKQRSSVMPNNIHRKHFDVLLLSPYHKIIFFDSDTLFLNIPTSMVQWATNGEKTCLYACQFEYPDYEIEGTHFCCTMVARILSEKYKKFDIYYFNSGLMCFHKEAYSQERIETLLKYLYSVGLEKSWAARQFIISVLISDYNNQKLSNKYIHIRTPEEFRRILKKGLSNYIFNHYSFTARQYFYPAALYLLMKTRFFRKQQP